MVGFSWGAAVALEIGADLAEAVVLYYGISTVDAPSWDVPLLGHFAVDDDFEPRDEVEEWFRRLEKGSGAEAELVVYPGTGHWFASTDVPHAFEAAAAAAAEAATIRFLEHHLA